MVNVELALDELLANPTHASVHLEYDVRLYNLDECATLASTTDGRVSATVLTTPFGILFTPFLGSITSRLKIILCSGLTIELIELVVGGLDVCAIVGRPVDLSLTELFR